MSEEEKKIDPIKALTLTYNYLAKCEGELKNAKGILKYIVKEMKKESDNNG